jgi:Ser-tRNA(Ala) deacylase AlaX
VAARKSDQDITYELPEGHTLQPGDPVRVVIEWDRRYRLMRLHFAAELILELIYKLAPDTEKVGAHIAANKARIDFAWEGSIAGEFPHLLADAHTLIERDVPIISAFSDAAQERRYWEVDGFARVPCGGTHIRRTGEVGPIRLKRNNIGKGKERIEITLDEQPA